MDLSSQPHEQSWELRNTLNSHTSESSSDLNLETTIWYLPTIYLTSKNLHFLNLENGSDKGHLLYMALGNTPELMYGQTPA